MTTAMSEIRRWKRPSFMEFEGELFVPNADGVFMSHGWVCLTTQFIDERKDFIVIRTLTQRFKLNRIEEVT